MREDIATRDGAASRSAQQGGERLLVRCAVRQRGGAVNVTVHRASRVGERRPADVGCSAIERRAR